MAATLKVGGDYREKYPTAKPGQPTGVKVIVVGAGFAGLACAIESRLAGHEVILLEKFKELLILGDIISFGANSGKLFERWGIGDELYKECSHLKTFDMHTAEGELLFQQPTEALRFGARSYNGHRGELHKICFEFALALGTDIRLDSGVDEFGEDESQAWVVLHTGEKLSADAVICADGVRSKAKKLVLGFDDKPKSSGYAIYRAWFSIDDTDMKTDPLTSWTIKDHDTFQGWIGNDVHFLCVVLKNAKDCSWVITHKDDADIEESWSFPGKIEDVLKIVKGWDPRAAAIISKAPSCVDWKLVYRDPMPTWVTKNARLCIIGDAAHPFLPTSVQGASQSMEDGVTIAVCLARSGKGDIQTALRAFEGIRYRRCRRAQLQGEIVRNAWHKTSAEESKKNPEKVKMKRQAWLLGHDSFAHAHAVYDEVAADIKTNGYKLPNLDNIDYESEELLQNAASSTATEYEDLASQPEPKAVA